MQGDAVITEGSAKQASEVMAIVRIEEDRALVDATLRDVQRDTWQFETRLSWHGNRRWEIQLSRCCDGAGRSVGGRARCR